MKSICLILTLAAGLMIALASVAEAGTESDTSAPPAFVGAEVSGPVTLREMVNVNDDVIYLGDLFANVDSRLADRVVAYAPDPGRQASYGAQWLYRIAQHFKLDWKPRTLRDQAIIIRESIIIEREQIEETIMMHLVEQGIDPDMDAELANRNIRLFLPATSMPELAVYDLKFDKQSGRFMATISAPANSPSAQKYRLAGRIFQMTEVPVLSRQISANEVIGANDIEWQRTRSDRLSRDTAMNPEELIGMAPKRGIREGTPIRLSEVSAPIVVKKKGLVTIIYQHPFMTLTAQGRSLQNGAVGDIIRVTNVQSNTIVDAEVIGSGQAVVRSIELLAMNQNN